MQANSNQTGIAARTGDTGQSKNILWSLIAVGVAVVTYVLLMADIRISLYPHAQFFSFVYGIDFAFVPQTGYVAEAMGFAITKGCMGATLFISAFLLLTLGFCPRGAAHRARFAFLVKAYAGCMAGALLISFLRIAVTLPFVHLPDAQLIHNIVSLAIYFGSICCLFFAMQKRQNAKEHDNEK